MNYYKWEIVYHNISHLYRSDVGLQISHHLNLHNVFRHHITEGSSFWYHQWRFNPTLAWIKRSIYCLKSVIKSSLFTINLHKKLGNIMYITIHLTCFNKELECHATLVAIPRFPTYSAWDPILMSQPIPLTHLTPLHFFSLQSSYSIV